MDMQHITFRSKSTQWPAWTKQTAKHRVSHNQSVLVKILQIVLILQDWNTCFQSETNQNYHQLHWEHHATHHKALSPDKFMLPGCKLSKDTRIWLKKISFQKQTKKSTVALIP